MSNEFFKVLIVGSSGKGKTFAARNLNQANIGILNIENKPLPFKNNFENHKRPVKYAEVLSDFISLGNNKALEGILLDSFSAYTELLLTEARNTKKGYDIWNLYNEELGRFLNLIKKCPKHVFVTAHYETLGIEGTMEKRVKVKGKEWEGMIEKEFTVVLFADSKLDQNGKAEYWFNTFQEGTSAKCPPDLFGEGVIKIPNDYDYILKKIQEFNM